MPAIDIAFGTLAVAQVRAEIEPFIETLVRPRAPRAILEIGTYGGGTLLLFADAAVSDALIVSIELPERNHFLRRMLYRSFAGARQRIVPIAADSTQPSTRLCVERALRGRPLDLLFIDGDHSYEGVRRDYLLYSPLVREGGLVAFHDITPGGGAGDVHRLWAQLAAEFETYEFCSSRSGFGIGVLVKPTGGTNRGA